MNVMADRWRARLEGLLGPQEASPGHDAGQFADPTARAFAEPFPLTDPVLIVDDDPVWAAECALSLRKLGYDSLIAPCPDDALELFASHAIALAIVDYNLPGRDGITLIHELAQMAEAQARKLHFIMATGYASKDVAIDAMRASAVDILEKPIRQADLRKALQRVRGLRDTPAAREALLDKMQSLSTELQRVARLIDDPDAARPASGPPARPAAAPARFAAADYDAAALADFIRELLRKEARRRGIGGGDLFGDPAWEMLLDLLLAKVEGRQVSVSSACIASGAPMSTALRLVGRLVDEGVLRKLADETDRRRHFLAIDAALEQPLIDYLIEQLRQKTASPEA